MDSSQAIRQEKAEAKLTREVNKSTVIVVEDSQIDFQIINEILSPTYHIVGFSDAEEALAQLDELDPALFLIDYNLPQMDGVSLCEALRSNHSFAFTPIIIITGETYTSYEYKFWDAGCDDFISKPFSAITLQRRVAKALKYQALINEYKDASMVDTLTKVFNRRYLDVVMTQMVNRSETPEITVLLLDVDFFKKYNDRYGHLAGDATLVRVAEAIKNALKRETDFVTRWGGEEFAIILPHTNKIGGQLVAERILHNIRCESILHEDSPTRLVTASIGGITYPSTPENWKVLFEKADIQLYEVKKAGRNNAIVNLLEDII